MNKLFLVLKNELLRYFISPLAYVYLVTFLLLNGSFAIYFGNFFERGQASLQTMFAYQPWLYLLFISGISMRLWAEEFRTKTILQIMTMPVSTADLVWGKFFAAWTFSALALLLTFPFWITVNILGNPDNMVIAMSYIGSFLLAGCMLSISQTMSALTKNQVIALVLAVITNLLFFLSGLEYVLQFFRIIAPLSIVDMVASFSFLTHFHTITQGLFEARDIIFFASIILLFNFTTIIIISFKTAGTAKFLKSNSSNFYTIIFIFLLIGFTGLNLTANNLLRRFQYDATEEKIFTLTDSTKRILKTLKEPVVAKLYYSRILGERNPEFRLMFDRIRILLQQYKNLSNNKFSYQIYYPEPLSNAEDIALAGGLQPLPIVDNSSNAFFGLTFSDEIENKNAIPFFTLERQGFVEQDLSEALYLLNHKKKTLGILTTLPIYEDVIEKVATPKWEIVNQLEHFYDITYIFEAKQINPNMDAILLIHPSALPKDLRESIINYSYSGGKVLAFFDIATEAMRIFSPATDIFKASETKEFEQAWDFVFYKNLVVADLANSSSIDATVDYKNNPIFTQDIIQFYISEDGFNKQMPETAQLKKMLVSSATVITPTEGSQNIFIPLIKASENSALMSSNAVYNSIHPSELLRRFKKDKNQKFIAAHIIGQDTGKNFDVIVVADTDLLYDSFWTTHKTILERNFSIPILDNANFVLNSLDSLIGEDVMIGLRGKTFKSRSFKDIEQKRKENLKAFSIKEKEIIERIIKTKLGLEEIWNKKSFEERQNFTPDELAIIGNIRKNLDSLRLELLHLRKNINKDISKSQNWVSFVNIYTIPLLIFLSLGAYILIYKRKKLSLNSTPMSFSKEAFYLSLIALILLSIGLLSAYINNQQDIAEYEGKKVFSTLPNKINDVKKIALKSHNSELILAKEKGLWTIPQHPHILVLQDRIKSFLSALLEATYFEKKSSKMEHLAKFDLSPIEVEGSKNIRIELQNSKGKDIENLEVGKIDIDLGRGSKGAYMKFDNKFQVWLVAVELIDLSTKWQDWTYSTLWNLRFGRLSKVNNITSSDTLAEIAKTLLNTPILGSQTSLSNSDIIQKLRLDIENNQVLEMTFYASEYRYFVSYNFITLPEEEKLQLFESYARGIFYEISKESLEKIENALGKRTIR